MPYYNSFECVQLQFSLVSCVFLPILCEKLYFWLNVGPEIGFSRPAPSFLCGKCTKPPNVNRVYPCKPIYRFWVSVHSIFSENHDFGLFRARKKVLFGGLLRVNNGFKSTKRLLLNVKHPPTSVP